VRQNSHCFKHLSFNGYRGIVRGTYLFVKGYVEKHSVFVYGVLLLLFNEKSVFLGENIYIYMCFEKKTD